MLHNISYFIYLKRTNIETIVSIMELYELKYFLGVAKFENIHRASEKLNISTASLSKAINRLEGELSVNLFIRERRNIKLTAQGRLLQKRASEIIQLEELTRIEVAGHLGVIQVIISGPEILLTKMGTSLGSTIKQKFPASLFDFHAENEENALVKVVQGEAHFALVSGDVPPKFNLDSKILAEAKFQTYIGLKHPLYKFAKSQKPVPVEEVLTHTFASPDNPLLGKVGARQSLDGWRDDQFPRKIEYLTSSLKILEELVVTGKAIAYLPSYFCESLPLVALNITGCPYSCIQKIKLVTRREKNISWLNQIF
jgi:DNA-binding transcriptional LysR family regulator